MINIEEISWENFLGYGNYTTRVNFKGYKGVCLIEGEHEGNDEREEGDEKLCASGKSSIIEAIIWGLFGNLSKKISPGNAVVNWHTGKNCIVRIKTVDGYEIVRTRKHDELGDEVLVFKDGEDQTRSTKKPAQQFINETFNIEYHTFMRSRIFSQFSAGFMELSQPKMTAVLERLMYVDNINPIAKTAKAKSDGIAKEVEAIDSVIESMNAEIDILEEGLQDLRDKDESFSDGQDTKIEAIKKEMVAEKQEVNDRIAKTTAKIAEKREEKVDDLIDIESLQAEWDQYEKNESNNKAVQKTIDAIDEKIADFESSVDSLTRMTELYTHEDHHDIESLEKEHAQLGKDQAHLVKLGSKHQGILESMAKVKAKISQEEEFIDNSAGVGECPKCKQEVTEDHVEKCRAESEDSIAKFKKLLAKLQSDMDKLNAEISEYQEKTLKVVMDVSEAKSENERIDSELALQGQHLKDLAIVKKKLAIMVKGKEEAESKLKKSSQPGMKVSEAETNNKYVQNIDQEIERLQERIEEIKSDFKKALLSSNDRIKDIRSEKSPYTQLIADQSKKLRSKKEEKEKKVKKLNEKKTLKAHVDYIRESYGNKRKIKAFWIGELIPDFNRYLKYYLEYFESKDKIEFNELLTPKMNRWSYLTHSGGECKQIDLSMMFSLNDTHVSNFGPQSNFMVLDEVDGRLDPFTINKLVGLLSDDISKRDDGLTNIFVISHRKEMKDRFPHKIRVKNKQERAYISNE